MSNPPLYFPVDYLDTDPDSERALDRFEIEVQLAIAQYVIKRVSGTEAGKEIFNGLMPKYEDRFPYHKLLAQYLTSPEYMETEKRECSDEDRNLDQEVDSDYKSD